MFIKRSLSATLKRFSKFPVVVLLGPRQSGKATLARETFKKHRYFTLEDPSTLDFIIKDPKRFLRENENEHGIIFDEFQHAPQLPSYLQIEADEKDRPGYFVLTGSQNFLMNQAISQSLAGRAGILHLMPLSIDELAQAKMLPDSSDEMIYRGGYPRLYAQTFTPEEMFPSYIRTYLERDVRQLLNVGDLGIFQKFMQLCAGRVGQQLNIADIATNCGINQRTVNQWLSILEASYIVFLLEPHFNNFNKRITKTPKLYFYDTGLACALLGIRTPRELAMSSFRGPLFESLIISDFAKQYYALGLDPALFFWRDLNGRLEVDCLITRGEKLFPVEIKSGETIANDFFNGIAQWSEIAGADPSQGSIIYAGTTSQKRSAGHVVDWQAAGSFIAKIEEN